MESKVTRLPKDGKTPDLWVTQKLYPKKEQIPPPPLVLAPPILSTGTVSPQPNLGRLCGHLNEPCFGISDPACFTSGVELPLSEPAALVVAYDGRTNQELWYGIGQTDSDSADPRISGQEAITAALANFPVRKRAKTTEPPGAIRCPARHLHHGRHLVSAPDFGIFQKKPGPRRRPEEKRPNRFGQRPILNQHDF